MLVQVPGYRGAGCFLKLWMRRRNPFDTGNGTAVFFASLSLYAQISTSPYSNRLADSRLARIARGNEIGLARCERAPRRIFGLAPLAQKTQNRNSLITDNGRREQ